MSSQTIESVLNETRTFAPDAAFVKQAAISGMAAYEALCAAAEKDFTGFWAGLAREHVLWNKPFTQILDESNAPFFKWFADGKLNASYNCLDRHLKSDRKNKAAIIWEGEPGDLRTITYYELYRDVCRFANVLKRLGVAKGDRVAIYMPLVPEASRGRSGVLSQTSQPWTRARAFGLDWNARITRSIMRRAVSGPKLLTSTRLANSMSPRATCSPASPPSPQRCRR